jgi:hypothetical protein
MMTKTKIVVAAALMLGTASAVHAQQDKIYPGIVVRPSTAGDPNPPSALAGHTACQEHYDTFDLATRTYVGDDGKRHPC